ncbi:MAG: hypothetical protein ACR5KV_05480 [Wolbachia sp.]
MDIPKETYLGCMWFNSFLNVGKLNLYRITARIPLQPFNLRETKEYLKYLGVDLNHQQVLQIYMAMGGIPYYLKEISKGLSTAQNINMICFQKDGLLFDEFDMLFHSLYEEPETYLSIIRAIAKKPKDQ